MALSGLHVGGCEDDCMQEIPQSPSPRSGMARRAWILVPAFAFIALLTFGLLRSGGAPEIGDMAPDFTAERLNGEGTLSLEELRGRPVLVNFWASWCGPCKDEAPMLRNAHERFGNQVHFLGVDIRDARGEAREFVRRYGLDYEHVRDERLEIYDDYGLTGQPETFLIDANGRIVQHISGPLLSENDLVVLLEGLLTRG
jgi:cytochrome c biogenesis protein CcmG, thiol:disulfide interchange protein DsbE